MHIKKEACAMAGGRPDRSLQFDRLWAGPPFSNFFSFFIFHFWLFGDGPSILEEWVYSTPIFWSLPLHLGVWNLPFLIELGDFIFFQILFLLNLEDTRTFISTIGILVSWKSEISKNSTRIACIMEFFCTLLQYMAHLSMFHSSPTSKIWYTCT
jgi:hypothetical protein